MMGQSFIALNYLQSYFVNAMHVFALITAPDLG